MGSGATRHMDSSMEPWVKMAETREREADEEEEEEEGDTT